MSIKKVIAAIRRYDSFVIATHTNMEGDALGSELGFYYLVKKLGKRAVIVNDEEIPYGYEFMPGLNVIRRYDRRSMDLKFDCFVTVDCSDLKRTGEVHMLNTRNKPVLNIDHHISNSLFGSVNWVDAHASCASEMVYRLYKALGVPLDRTSATALYVGILTDTGSFRYSNTSALTHKITADLLTHGIDVLDVYRQIYGSVPYDDLKLFIKILPTMRVELGGKIVWFAVPKSILHRQKKIYFDLSESLLNFARTLRGIEVALLFRENMTQEPEVRVNFRSQGKIDVNKIANCFGGGGHKNASGATVKGRKLDEVRRMVLHKLKAEFKTLNGSRHARPPTHGI